LMLTDAPLMVEAALGMPALEAPHARPYGTAAGSLALLDDAGEVRPLEDIEAETVRFAIAHYHGQMSEVARRLRIGRSTLYRKLDSLGLTGDETVIDNHEGVADR
jgi:DNA-binding NtrC family response regulator